MPTKYIHFTDRAGAKAIKSTGTLMKSSYVEGVYAIEEGSLFVPGVQKTTMGRASDRNVAVVFTTQENPDTYRNEEVIWREEDIPVNVLQIMPSEKAIDTYLIEVFNRAELFDDIEVALQRSPVSREDETILRKIADRMGLSPDDVTIFIVEVWGRRDDLFFALTIDWPLDIEPKRKPGVRLLESLIGSYVQKKLSDVTISGVDFVQQDRGTRNLFFADEVVNTLQTVMRIDLSDKKLASLVACLYGELS